VSFNPVYGQGMSTAAESVVLLNNLVRTLGPDSSLGPVFQNKVKDLLTLPWFFSTVNDLQYAESKHSAFANFVSVVGGKFLLLILKATLTDTYVLDEFLKVVGMEEGYIETLLSPKFNFRVIFQSKASTNADKNKKQL